jgi:hypothetical protein
MHKIAVKRPDTSALGQKRTFAPQKVMSALTPKVRSATAHVCYGPKATFCFSLDNHISPLEEGLRNCQTKRPGRLEIDDKFKFGRLLNWHVRRQSTLQYFGYKPCALPKRSRTIGAIRQQAASFCKRSRTCRCSVPYRQVCDVFRRQAALEHNCARPFFLHVLQCGFDFPSSTHHC